MSSQRYCPNCKAATEASASVCRACCASFEEGSAWRAQTAIKGADRAPTRAVQALCALGLAMLAATLFPFGARLLAAATGGMYGPVFKPASPALYLLTSYLVNYVPLAVVVWWLLKRFRVIERAPSRFRSSGFFGTGVALVTLYAAARVLAATVQGGGAGFAVAALSPFVLIPALVLLTIGAVRLTYGFGKGAV